MRRIPLILAIIATTAFSAVSRAEAAPQTRPTWQVGTPIVTYFAGPAMSEAVATQMAAGGFNVVWCNEKDLDLLKQHNLRGMLHSDLLVPATLNSPAQLQKLDALIDRVRDHPAFHSYFITDEPGAPAFAGLGKLVAHLKQRDPHRLAYINLFPTYATNDQLGTKGDPTAAYQDYLRQFIDVVKPELLSWDHYQFYKGHDTDQYFLNLSLVREASLKSGIPFLNIIQAAAWEPTVRVPTADETRYLVSTSAAYGAQGISYYVYNAAGHEGGIATADGTPTPIYETLKTLNPAFVAIATELQPLQSLGVYHTTLKAPGCVPPPPDLPFHFWPDPQNASPRGFLLGTFGSAADGSDTRPSRPTHVLVVNLDYGAKGSIFLDNPGSLTTFDQYTKRWTAPSQYRTHLTLPPGGGTLVRMTFGPSRAAP